MRMPLVTALAGAVLLAGGCVEPFEGSHLQFTLTNVPQPCQVLLLNDLPGKVFCMDKQGNALSREEMRFVFHYELWATVNKSAATQLLSFTVQPHLFPEEQKDFDKRAIKLSNGKTFKMGGQSGESYFRDMTDEERTTADKQLAKAAGVNAITSFSYVTFNPDQSRLHEDFYLGSHTQLSLPHNGVYYGQVEGSHPYGAVTLSGGSTRIAPNLENLDSLWITIEQRDPRRPDPEPSDLIYLQGMAQQTVRGVINVDATSPIDPTARAAFGVMYGLGEEEYF